MNDIQRRKEIALRADGDTPAVRRLWNCAQVRNHRGDLNQCNRPPCPRCGELSGNRFAKRAVFPFTSIAAEAGYSLHYLTIILPPTADIWVAGRLLDQAKRTVKDCILGVARRCPVFEGSFFSGGYEMGLIHDNKFEWMSPGKQQTMGALGFPHGESGGPVWLPHLHLALALPPGADIATARAALARFFPAYRQIDVRAVDGGGADCEVMKTVMRYPLKHELRLDLQEGLPVVSWDTEEVTTYARWAESLSSHGYRGLRFMSGRQRFLDSMADRLDAAHAEWEREMLAEDEWLFGAGSGGSDADLDPDMGDVGLPDHDGRSAVDQGVFSSSNGGVSTTTTRPGLPRCTARCGRTTAPAGAARTARWDRHGSSASCRGPPLSGAV